MVFDVLAPLALSLIVLSVADGSVVVVYSPASAVIVDPVAAVAAAFVSSSSSCSCSPRYSRNDAWVVTT